MASTLSPIDFVIPWVDGSDPEWQNERARWKEEETESVHSFDYCDWGLLPYWFRSIEKNAPWVRRIHFITCGQLPDWLDTGHPKLHIVRHSDYIPAQYLPTFSSHVIELNLHRIPELSEQFIYFNDDTFLLNPVMPTDFFRNGKPCDSALMSPVVAANRETVAILQLHVSAILNEHFNKKEVIRKNRLQWYNLKYGLRGLLNYFFIPWPYFPGFYEQHLAASYLKSTFEEVWKTEYEALDQTCRHRFRNYREDVNQYLIKEWQLAKGDFHPRKTGFGRFLSVNKSDDAASACALLRSKIKSICINDHLEGDDVTDAIRQIKIGFQERFPEKSSFEL